MRTFKYNIERVYNKEFEVENIGNAKLEAEMLDGSFRYLYITTILGQTYAYFFQQYDEELIPTTPSISFNYLHFEYSENKVIKLIQDFIKDNKIFNVSVLKEEDNIDEKYYNAVEFLKTIYMKQIKEK